MDYAGVGDAGADLARNHCRGAARILRRAAAAHQAAELLLRRRGPRLPDARGRRTAPQAENRRRQRPGVCGAAAAFDDDYTTQARLPLWFDLVFDKPVQARSVFVRMARASQDYHAELLAWDEDKGKFNSVAKFESHISGPFSPHIGSATFPAVQARKFRLAFDQVQSGNQVFIEEMALQGGYRVTNWTSKAGFATDNVAANPGDAQPQPADAIALDKIVDLTEKTRSRRPPDVVGAGGALDDLAARLHADGRDALPATDGRQRARLRQAQP